MWVSPLSRSIEKIRGGRLMPYLNGIYLSEQNYDALGEIAKKEEKSRVQYVKALVEERVQNEE